jgi:mono/diheme cytochrome c family protein
MGGVARRLLLLLAAVGVGIANAAVFAAFWPPPAAPPDASPAERTYFASCARCHGPDGRGSWRARILLIRPGDLADARQMRALTDQYLFDVVKHGGAPFGKPGMPAFAFHLSDAQIQELVRFLRTLPGRGGEISLGRPTPPRDNRAR